MWVVFFTLSAKYLNIKPSPQLLIAILVASLHPYMAEILTFRIATLSLAVSLIISSAILYLFVRHQQTSKGHFLILAGVCVFILGVFYQTLLNHIVIVFLFKLFVISFTFKRNRESISLLRNTMLQIVTLVLGFGAYLASNRLIQNTLGVTPSSRSQLIDGEDVPNRVNEILILIETVFTGEEPVLTLGFKLIFWLIVGVGLLGLVATRRGRVAREVPALVVTGVTAFLVFGLLLMVPGMIFAFSNWWPVPRVIAHNSLYFAAGVYLALMAVKARTFLQPINVALSVLLVMAFSLSTFTIFQEQQKLNRLDRETAQTIGVMIKSQTPLEKITSLEVVGAKYFYPGEITTTQGDLNISAFGAAYTKNLILEKELDLSLVPPSEEQKALSLEHCRSVEPWPAKESVKVFSGHAVVCLGGE
jgi:hypothetical protein